MSRLQRLVRDHIRELSGTEFKIAAYLICRLGRRREVMTNIKDLALATGVSWRQTQSALRSLAKKGIFRVEGRQHEGTRCSLPAVPAGTRAAQSSSQSPRRPTADRSKGLPAQVESMPATPAPEPPPTLPPPAPSEPPEAGSSETAAAPAPPSSTSRASASPRSQDDERAAKEQSAHALICKLLQRRYNISPADFSWLLGNADGEIDRLIRRLQDLAAYNRFESVMELGAAVHSLVRIR